ERRVDARGRTCSKRAVKGGEAQLGERDRGYGIIGRKGLHGQKRGPAEGQGPISGIAQPDEGLPVVPCSAPRGVKSRSLERCRERIVIGLRLGSIDQTKGI